MYRSFSLIFIFFISSAYSQNHLSANTKAKPINITDWVINTPKDKNLKGKFIILNFWSLDKNVERNYNFETKFNAFNDKFNRKDVYFITMTSEKVQDLKDYFKTVKFNSIVVSDQKKITQTYYGSKDGSIYLPLTILIDNNGIIKWIGLPYDLTDKILTEFLDGSLTPYNMFVKPKNK